MFYINLIDIMHYSMLCYFADRWKGLRAVVPKFVWAVTQIKVMIMSYCPQYFTVITHNTKQNYGFGSASPLKELRITPGDNLPPVWEPLP